MNVLKAWFPPLVDHGATVQHTLCTAAITARLIGSPSAHALRVGALQSTPNMPALQMLGQDLQDTSATQLHVHAGMFPDKQLMEMAASTSLPAPHSLRATCTRQSDWIDLRIPDGFARNCANLYSQIVNAYTWRAEQPTSPDWAAVSRCSYDALRFHYRQNKEVDALEVMGELPPFNLSHPNMVAHVMSHMGQTVLETYGSNANFLDKRIIGNGALRTHDHVRNMAETKA